MPSTKVSVRRTLYLSPVKSQLSYATHVWSPSQLGLKAKMERVQKRTTSWILQSKVGELSYRERLKELKDLVFFYKCLVVQDKVILSI